MHIPAPPPISGGLILSYKCTASCRHCMYACSPKWKNEWIEKETLKSMLKLLSNYILPSPYGRDTIGVSHGLHFTGGEPFLNYDLLLFACEVATGYGIPSLFAETNCYWAMDDSKALDMLLNLREAGLKGILISVNPFFLEYIPFERTEIAIKAALEVFGQNVVVYQFEYYRLFKSLGVKGQMRFEDFLSIEGTRSFIDRTEFFIMGRAAIKMNEMNLFPKYRAERFFSSKCVPSFSRPWHNHFDLYSNFIPGFCGGISLGNIFEIKTLINEGIDTERFPILGFLFKEDIKGLLSFAKNYGYQEKENGYLSNCHLCLDIRRFLYSLEKFEELAPSQFYEKLI